MCDPLRLCPDDFAEPRGPDNRLRAIGRNRVVDLPWHPATCWYRAIEPAGVRVGHRHKAAPAGNRKQCGARQEAPSDKAALEKLDDLTVLQTVSDSMAGRDRRRSTTSRRRRAGGAGRCRRHTGTAHRAAVRDAAPGPRLSRQVRRGRGEPRDGPLELPLTHRLLRPATPAMTSAGGEQSDSRRDAPPAAGDRRPVAAGRPCQHERQRADARGPEALPTVR